MDKHDSEATEPTAKPDYAEYLADCEAQKNIIPTCSCAEFYGKHHPHCPVLKTIADQQAKIERLEAAEKAIGRIKSQVVGDRNPNWTDDFAATQTRMRIADIADSVLTKALKENNNE